MDLRLFHATDDPTVNYKILDYHNSRTGLFACHLLELIGWYTSDVKHRLLGHYRLFQLYKKRRANSSSALPLVQGYILQYRSSYWIKHYWYLFISRLPSLISPDRQMEMYLINKTLVYQRATVLYDFLANADTDFEQAFKNAVLQINDPEFINTASFTKTQYSNLFLNLEHHTVNNLSHNELNIHPIVEKEKETILEKETIIIEPAKELTGKEQGVFSKKQVLILFDLMSRVSKLERFPLCKPGKQKAIAQFLQALTGKGEDTWLETLKDYRHDNLYAWHTPGERSRLIGTLTNLGEITHKAGLGSITSEAEKMIRELRAKE
ncbi:MAG TPA: hypothetical protein VNW04_13135 [Puia sp.]|nr:hypothetical protein [Puia sp.]